MYEHFPVEVAHAVRRATWEGWKIPERRIWNHELVMLLRGQGYISIRGERFAVQPGDLILFYPGVWHSLWVESEPYMEFIGLHFELPEGTEMIKLPEIMHVGKNSRIEQLIKEAHETFVKKTYLHTWRQNALAEQVLCEICLHQQKRHTPAEARYIAGAIEYIHSQPYRDVPLEELLEQAGVQKTQFLQAFRRVTGTTPKQYILTLRLEHARDLLMETNWPIAQIAEESGFDDAFYFSRCFKQHFAVSPREYRKRNV